MNIIIKVNLKNSASIETPEAIKQMVTSRMDELIKGDSMLDIFVAGYSVDVVP